MSLVCLCVSFGCFLIPRYAHLARVHISLHISPGLPMLYLYHLVDSACLTVKDSTRVYYILHHVSCILYTVYCLLYTVYCLLYLLHCVGTPLWMAPEVCGLTVRVSGDGGSTAGRTTDAMRGIKGDVWSLGEYQSMATL